jgi:hypothetical protein
MTEEERIKAALKPGRLEPMEIAQQLSDLNSQARDFELSLIDERIREHEADPDEGVPWERVKAELWPDL